MLAAHGAKVGLIAIVDEGQRAAVRAERHRIRVIVRLGQISDHRRPAPARIVRRGQ
jgi:hypothetical protein